MLRLRPLKKTHQTAGPDHHTTTRPPLDGALSDDNAMTQSDFLPLNVKLKLDKGKASCNLNFFFYDMYPHFTNSYALVAGCTECDNNFPVKGQRN